MNRRELIIKIAAGTATVFVVPALLTSCEEDMADPDGNDPSGNGDLTIDLSLDKYSQLNAAGGSVIERSIIIINTGNEFIALSSVCTHQGCTVSYSHGAGNLPCPCHGSIFSTSGSVLNGPAGSPLKKYQVTRDGNMLTIKE